MGSHSRNHFEFLVYDNVLPLVFEALSTHSYPHATTSRGRGPQGRTRGGGRGGFVDRGRGSGLKRSWQGQVRDPGELLTASYSLETLMAVEFTSDLSIEQLGDEMAKAMGERDPRTVKSIVRACGVDKAIALFEEMRKVESTGGMMVLRDVFVYAVVHLLTEEVFQIENGQRRRTPGGVFITLFKLDPDVPGDVKKQVFGETKQEARKMLRARKKGHNNFANDVAKLAEIMKKEKEKSTAGEGMSEDSQPLKPLPSVEEVVFQKQTTDTMMVDGDADEVQSAVCIQCLAYCPTFLKSAELWMSDESGISSTTTEWKKVEEQFEREKMEEARLQQQRWKKWEMEFIESQQRAREFKAYWERRRKDDTDLWRDKDFADAVYKMSRAGYKGEYGHYEVPEEDKIYMEALYMQVTVGDYDGNESLQCAEEWKKLVGKTRIDAQREYIHHTNKMITRYGWNAPDD
ncbi:hypothetical protein GCK32_001378 [Trichostrongylus colubriformis]|uniref:Phosphorylated adapter RNA export protein n=1 Tax=Trichostrongylus colubriformis TaxID=6319 RepID=A0AAN8F1J2_TRICO